MKFLVTGGLGFIGSALIRFVISETKHEILNLDKESYASMPESLHEVEKSEHYHFIKLNINNISILHLNVKIILKIKDVNFLDKDYKIYHN